MLQNLQQILPWILLVILFIFFIINIMSSSLRIRRLERKYRLFMKGTDGKSLEKAFLRKFNQIDKLFEWEDSHKQEINSIQSILGASFTKYGVEKYDAFEDIGGKLSFALALLDKDNNGIILNAVHSRDNCFLYLKEIVKGESYVVLSQEEVEALRKAVHFNNDIYES